MSRQLWFDISRIGTREVLAETPQPQPRPCRRHTASGLSFGLLVEMYQVEEYEAPLWLRTALCDAVIPKTKVKLASLPTPIHRFNAPGLNIRFLFF
jgi:hypothetical protein